jgi:hypothetical protein
MQAFRVPAKCQWVSAVTTLLVACASTVLPSTILLGSSTARAADDAAKSTTSTIPPFPGGYDWPANPAVIEKAITNGDWATLRTHGWWLWIGLNTTTANGHPLWCSWPTSTQAFNTTDTGALGSAAGHARTLNAANVANTPINLPAPWYPVPTVNGNTCVTGTSTDLPDGTQFEANGDVMIAGVIYNQDSYDWVRNTPLNQASVLTKALNNGDKTISPFPATSIVLKHMYWPARGDGYTALPVWHPEKYPPLPAKYIGYEYWKDTVAIDPGGAPVPAGKTAQVSYLYHFYEHDKKTLFPTQTRTAKVVSVNDFYNHRVDAAELASMSANDRTILNASACWLYNRPFAAGDYLVSVAMHINTKEIPTWALQSLWWSDMPDAGPYAANRPDINPQKGPGPWRHYLMTLEYGIDAAPGMLPVAFNPFIELAAAHPIQTNCRNCHTRAAWPRKDVIEPPPKSVASYEAAGGPGALVDLKPDNPIFQALMRVDFQWAVSDRAH